MLKRPLCLVCLIIISVILVCRLAGIPVFGEPVLSAAEKQLLQDGCQVFAAGIVTDRQETGETCRYTLAHAVVMLSGRRISFSRILVSTERKEKACPLGSVISAEGEMHPVEKAGNPGQFDAASYYGSKKIWYRIWTEQITLLHPGGGLREELRQIRERTEHLFAGSLGEEQTGILTAMLLGDKTLLTEESRLDFQLGGCLHLLVISGLHVSLLGMAVFKVLLLLRLPQGAAGFLAAVLMSLYTLMTGASAAAVRACIMFLVFLLARIAKRPYDSPSAMALAA